MATKALFSSEAAEAAELQTERLDKYAIREMISYGNEVIENRALPDFRDGLKPVQRYILYSMFKEGIRFSGATKKSARIVGDVMGKYHPHGDSSIYGAAVALALAPCPMIHPQGDFGDFNGDPADMRYTEMKLSAYAEKILLNREYMQTIKVLPNYDGEETEPLILPALLPNLLLNGVSGIAVGVTVNIPPFKIGGVIKLVKLALKGKELTAKNCAKHLRIYYPAPFNSVVLTSDADLLQFYKTGTGNLSLGVNYTATGDTMLVDQFPPYFKMAREINMLLDKIPEVARAEDISDGEKRLLRIVLKAGQPVMGRSEIFTKCAKLLAGRPIAMRINFIERIDKDNIKFDTCNMPQLIMRWVKWRIELEITMLKNRLANTEKECDHISILILACDNLDAVVKELKKKTGNLVARLAAVLKITEEQAGYIARMQVQSLSALSRDELNGQLTKLKSAAKQTKREIRQPAKKILADLSSLVK